MRKSLFRPEATANRGSAWYGNIILLQPLSLRLISWCIVLFAACTVIFLCRAHYTKHIAVSGVLAPDRGLIKVQAPHRAIVLERRVREGQQVQAGEVLYVVSSEVMYAPGNDKAQRAGISSALLEQLRTRQETIQADGLSTAALAEREQMRQGALAASLQGEVQLVDKEIAIQRERLDAKNVVYEANVQARAQGFLSPLALQQKYDELLDQRARLQDMERTRHKLVREQAAAEAALKALDARNALARSELARQMLRIEQDRVAQESVNRTLITAPQAGVVAAVLTEPGQRVDEQTLLTIVPQGSALEALLFVPSSQIGNLREGDAVSLRLAAFPYQKYGGIEGRIKEISSTTVNTADLSADAGRQAPTTDPRYRVRVELPERQLAGFGRRHQLRSGMLVDARFKQETRALIDWILAPLGDLKDKL